MPTEAPTSARLELHQIRLQPFRIPAGWTVILNSFYDLDPGADVKVTGLPDEDPWELFTQDMLQLQNALAGIVVDLGWVPEAAPDGAFQLSVVQGDNWALPLLSESLGTREKAVQAVEEALVRYSSG